MVILGAIHGGDLIWPDCLYKGFKFLANFLEYIAASADSAGRVNITLSGRHSHRNSISNFMWP
jgi:hypothetical protein